MAVTNNLTLIHGCNAATDATTSHVINDSGGAADGLKTFAADEITPKEGTGCWGLDLDVETLYIDITHASSSWNFTNSTLYLWAAFLTASYLDTWQNGGFTCRLIDGSANYSEWYLGGSDTLSSDWGRYCFSTSTTPDAVSGTLSITAVTEIRFYFTGVTKSKLPENILIDYVQYGADGVGITVTGGTVGTPETLEDVYGDDNTAVIGIVQKNNGIFFLNGPVTWGDSGGTSDMYFADTSEVVATIERYRSFTTTNRTSAETLLSSSHYDITVEGNSTGTCSFVLGDVSGTTGYNGLIIKTGGDIRPTFTVGNANVDTLGLYGCTLIDMGLITFVNDASHLIYSTSFIGCLQVVPVGAPKFRNCLFVATNDTDAAILWNASIDIQDCTFAANTIGAAIEHPTAGSYSYTALLFSGNTYDILSSNAAGTISGSYSESNYSLDYGFDGSYTAFSQSFQNVTQGYLSMAKFYLRKIGTPAGNIVAKLYAHSGTYGTSSVPTGAALAESKPVVATSLSASYGLIEFDFGDRYQMAASTYYCIVIEYTGYAPANTVEIGIDFTTPSHGGNWAEYVSSWTVDNTLDACFYVYRDGEVVVNASGVSNPTTYEETNTNVSTVIYNTKTLTVTCKNAFGLVIEGIRVRIEVESTGALISHGRVNPSGVYSDATYNYAGDVDVIIKARLKGYNDNQASDEITANGLSVPFTMLRDRAVNLP